MKKIEDIKPMSLVKDSLSYEQYKEFQKQYELECNSNEIVLSAKVSAKNFTEGKEITDKQTGMPILDNEGNVRKYPNAYYIKLVFKGGDFTYKVKSLEEYNAFNVGSSYKFNGYLGFIKEFGKEVLSPIFTAWTEI